MNLDSYVIRRFQEEDAEPCFKMRTEAFLKIFYNEIGPNNVAVGINAYMPRDYVRLAETMPTFVASDDRGPVGFITLRFIDQATSEILFVYVQMDLLGQGLGTRLVGYAEQWVQEKHPEIDRIVVDTVIPNYNQGFYEKLGYKRIGESECEYPAGPVKAVRLAKNLRSVEPEI